MLSYGAARRARDHSKWSLGIRSLVPEESGLPEPQTKKTPLRVLAAPNCKKTFRKRVRLRQEDHAYYRRSPSGAPFG
jgi:hypothetical protein